MLVSEAISVPTFVLGGLRGSTATSDLVQFHVHVQLGAVNLVLGGH